MNVYHAPLVDDNEYREEEEEEIKATEIRLHFYPLKDEAEMTMK